MSIQLPADVYQEQSEYIALVNDVTNSIDGDTPEETVREQVELLLSGVGRDLLKLHGLVQAVYAKMESKLDWAKSAGVAFYRILFEAIDPTLEFEVFGDCKLGASIVVQYILDAADEFIACPTWGIRNSVAVLEVAAILIEEQLSATTVSLACGLFEKMAQSFYIFFDDNYGVFVPFLRRVSHHLDAAEETGKSIRITNMLDMLKEADYERTDLQIFQIKRLYDTLGRSHLYEQIAVPVPVPASLPAIPLEDHATIAPIPERALEREVAESLAIFGVQANWTCPEIDRIVNSVTKAMKIGAILAIQTTTYDTIAAMIESEHLFLHKNLEMLLYFIFAVAPALDGMADTSQSDRLTAFLDTLRNNPDKRTNEEHSGIEDLRRNLGRSYEIVEERLSGKNEEEQWLADAAAKLGIHD